MPELPEVESVVRALAPHLPGRTITAVDLRRTDIACEGRFRRSKSATPVDLVGRLRGRTLLTVTRRAKRIVLTLDDGARLHIHLGMTGVLTYAPADTPPNPAKHTHLLLTLSPPTPPSLRISDIAHLTFQDPRRFGRVIYLSPTCPDDDDLGPEPLTLTPDAFHARLTRTKRPLKSALLDQRLIAGLGNIYVDESLHRARLHPLTPPPSLTEGQTKTLLESIQHTLTQAIAHRGSTLRDYRTPDGDEGGYQQHHHVYARDGRPCRSCDKPIERITLGGRSTHFCPKCQPLARRPRNRTPKRK